MRVMREGGQLVLRDRPGPFWALGLLLLSGGVLAIAMPLGLASSAGEIEPWGRLASIAIGLANAAGAIWWLNRSLATRAEFDLTRRRLTLVRVGLPGRRVVRLELTDIAGVEAEKGCDSEGGVIWRPVLRLRSGERMNLSELWSHDEKTVQQAVSAVAQACRLLLATFFVSLFTACSDGTSPRGIPDGPSAVLTVEYLAGGEAALPSTILTVTRAPVEIAPGNTTWCADIYVQGSTPSGPLDPDRPQVSNPSVAMCADEFQNFPVPFDAVIDGTLENRGTSFATANSVSYQADSGSVHLQPLVGGYAQVDMDAWYRTRGSTSPFTFRIRGRLIAHE